jgi:hypothetical protein
LRKGDRQGKWFKGYGYQTWIHKRGSFWWNRRGGQRVGMDANSKLIFSLLVIKKNTLLQFINCLLKCKIDKKYTFIGYC